jgi:hypothetical protein
MPVLLNQTTFQSSSKRADQYYFPSCVVRLIIRLEESFQPESSTMPDPASVDNAVWAPTTQALLPSANTLPNFMTGARDALTFQVDRVPKVASIELPGYRIAGKFSMTFDYRDLPLDPRQIRAIGVQIHLGAVTGKNFAAGITAPLALGGRSSVLQIQDVGGQPDPATLLQVGTVDDLCYKHDKERSEFTISGRDLTGILLDTPIRPELLTKLDLTKPIDSVIRQIIAFNPLLSDALDVRPNSGVVGKKDNDRYLAEWPNNTPLSPGDIDGLTRVRLGPNASQGTPAATGPGMTAPGAPNNVNMWDMITRYCQPGDALIWRDDLSWAKISDIRVGDRVVGFAQDATGKQKNFRKFVSAEVEKISIRKAPVIALHMESGRVVRCTANHRWFTGRAEPKYAFAQPKVGGTLVRVADQPQLPFTPDYDYKLGYARGIIEGDGCYIDKTYVYSGKRSRTKSITVAMNDRKSLDRYATFCRDLGLNPRECIKRDSRNNYEQPCVRMCAQRAIDLLILSKEPSSDNYLKGWLAGIFDAEGSTGQLCIAQYKEVNPETYQKIAFNLKKFAFDIAEDPEVIRIRGGISEVLRFFRLVQPASVFKFQRRIFGQRMFGTPDKIVRIEQCGEEDVYSLQTSAETYFGQGYASHNCFLVGAVPYFVGQVLWIRRARNLFDTYLKNPTTVIDPDRDQPFHGIRNWTTSNTSEPLQVRRVVYGLNIQDLQMERKIGGVTKPVIELVCMNTSSNARGMKFDPALGAQVPAKLLLSQYPKSPQGTPANNNKKKHQRSTKVSPNGNKAMTDIMRIAVHGISSQERLDQMAQDVWTEIAYQEIGGRFTTKDLSSLGGGNTDPDLLRLRPGDPIQVMIRSDVAQSASPVNTELIRLERLKQAAQANDIAKRTGIPPTAADAVARTAKGNAIPELQNTFRVTNVKFAWAAGEGVNISAEFQNYITELVAGDSTDPQSMPAAASGPSVPGATVSKVPTNQPAATPPGANSSKGGH